MNSLPGTQFLAKGEALGFTVTGDCMVPALNPGDRVEATHLARYWPGDMLVFTGPDGAFLVHRLLGPVPRRRLMTSADRGVARDALFARNRVVGKVTKINGNAAHTPLATRIKAALSFSGHCLRLGLRQLRRTTG